MADRLPAPTGVPEATRGERALLEAVEAGEARLLDLLGALIRFRTPNPPGGNEREAQQWMAQRMAELGLEVDRWDVLPGRPNVVGVLRGLGGGPTAVLNGHIDVCEDRLLDRWASDPYEPVVRDGRLFGRGASDMKSALASFLFAVTVLREHGVRLRGDVILQSVMGEEGGDPGTRSAIEHGHTGDFAVVGECSRGRDLVASIGVVNCRITVAGDATLHLQARKRTLNAGGGLDGANCVDKLALRILPALHDLEREWAVFKTHPLVPPGSCAINVFRIEGGTNPFILPLRCDAYATVTYLPSERREDVTAEVEERIAAAAALDRWLRRHRPTVEWDPPQHPLEYAAADFDPESPHVAPLAEAVAAVTGEHPRLGGRGAITDAGWFHRARIPVVVFGPGDIEEAHALNECVRVSALLDHCKAITLFLARYCGTDDH
jgi:acetylornithine deacetylase/succinyl-diaminopimelate desuccinylase family protein